MHTTCPAERRFVLPVLGLLFLAALGVIAACLLAFDRYEGTVVEAELAEGSRARVAHAVRARHHRVLRQGELIPAPSTQVEARATVVFCAKADNADVPALREVALCSPDTLAASNAIRALGRLRRVARDPELVALLSDSRERVRHETILALGASRDRRAEEHLLPLATGGDRTTRVLALHALGRLGGEGAARAADAVLGDAAASPAEKTFARAALAAARR